MGWLGSADVFVRAHKKQERKNETNANEESGWWRRKKKAKEPNNEKLRNATVRNVYQER